MRYRIIYILPESFLSMLCRGIQSITELPSDVTIINSGFDVARNLLYITIHSKEFEELKEGMEIPQQQMVLKYQRKK